MAKQKITFSKEGNWVYAGDLLADIDKLCTRNDAGEDDNIFKVGDTIHVHWKIVYPDVIADLHAQCTLRLICLQLSPTLQNYSAYSTELPLTLDENTEEREDDPPVTFVAQRVGTPGIPGVYVYIGTLDFGAASDFGAYLYSNVFFVF